jgi:Xaa-Pro aminopeptidase
MPNYILRDESAVYYECGFSCDNEIFLKLGSEAFFITDSRYTIEANEFVKDAQVVTADRDLIVKAKNIIRKSKIKSINYDPNEWCVAGFDKLSRSLDLKFVKRVKLSHKKRIIKRDDEIKLLKEAVKFGKDGFEKFAEFLRELHEPLSEKRVWFELRTLLQNYGEMGLSFDPIVAINENAAKPHALPSNKILSKGDLLLVDAGVKYKRYCSDRTRVATFGKTLSFDKNRTFNDKKRQKIYDTVLKAQEAAIKYIKPGVKACDIDKVAREIIDKEGFGKLFTHSTGHGVGLDIHEEPYISKKSKTIIEEGMVFTVEPGIYIEGEFGVRIEDMVVVRGDGAEIL